MSKKRAGRVADQIRQDLAVLLREEVHDPRVGFVTLTDVDLSTDLRYARVFVSFLSDDHEESLRTLRRSATYLRKCLARAASLRFTPELRFEIDASVESGSRVDRILDEIGETLHQDEAVDGDDS
jgi:ribosome-binding factor A